MKILLLDIETAPNLVHVWGLWNQNIGLPQILDAGYVLCWSAKWLGKDEVYFSSVHQTTPKKMLKGIHKLLEEADAVVHYNGSKFDIPTLNKEFLLHNLMPPASYKQIDLLRTARSQFKFVSNKLDYIARTLGVGEKIKHRGHELWIKCMAKDDEAWKEMEAYNIQDVLILEKVYYKLLPWIKNHPNVGVHDDKEHACSNCGSHHIQFRGYSVTAAGKYRRFQCQQCGTWNRERKNEATKNTLTQDKS